MSCFNEITNACDAFDDSLASWTHWQFKGFGDFTTTGGSNEGVYDNDGKIQENKLKALTRSYVHAFQGTPTKMEFDIQTGTLRTDYIIDNTITSPTEVYTYNDIHYPFGFRSSIVINDQPTTDVKLEPTSSPYYSTLYAWCVNTWHDIFSLSSSQIRSPLGPVTLDL